MPIQASLRSNANQQSFIIPAAVDVFQAMPSGATRPKKQLEAVTGLCRHLQITNQTHSCFQAAQPYLSSPSLVLKDTYR
jgi:hypothetical protein